MDLASTVLVDASTSKGGEVAWGKVVLTRSARTVKEVVTEL